MIQLPDAIVVYPQKKEVPDFLLCWIPAEAYEEVVVAEQRAEVAELYPDGMEVALTEDALAEAGIELGIAPETVRQAYLDLRALELLPASGMVTVAAIERYVEAVAASSGAPRPEGAKGLSLAEALVEEELRAQISGGPPMTEGQAPDAVYQRLSGVQRADREEEGDA